MIVAAHEARAIAQGRKTSLRVVALTDRCPYPVGSSHPVQPGAGEPSEAQIAVLEFRRERLGAISAADAKAEGNLNVEWFKQAWVRKHDRVWMAREKVQLADVFGDEVVPVILCKRFDEEWAQVDVWVVRFWLTEVRPRYLARPTRTGGDYTTSVSRSIDNELTVVAQADGTTRLQLVPVPIADPEYAARKAREDHDVWVAQRDSFRRDLEEERARRKAERGRVGRAA